jgi:hypothetical protein
MARLVRARVGLFRVRYFFEDNEGIAREVPISDFFATRKLAAAYRMKQSRLLNGKMSGYWLSHLKVVDEGEYTVGRDVGSGG